MEYTTVNMFRRGLSFFTFLAFFSLVIILFYTPEPELPDDFRIDIFKVSISPFRVSRTTRTSADSVSPLRKVSITNWKLSKFQRSHVPGSISDVELQTLVKSIDVNEFKKILKPFLVQRIPGSSGHSNVKNVSIRPLRKLNLFQHWLVS